MHPWLRAAHLWAACPSFLGTGLELHTGIERGLRYKQHSERGTKAVTRVSPQKLGVGWMPDAPLSIAPGVCVWGEGGTMMERVMSRSSVWSLFVPWFDIYAYLPTGHFQV